MLHIKKIKPLFTSVITTCDRYDKDIHKGGIIEEGKTAGSLKLYQKVLAIGDTVRGISVGDLVMINLANYVVMKYDKNSLQNDLDNNKKVRINLPIVEMDDEEGNPTDCLLLNDRDIQYVFEGYEEDESIIIPEKPKFVAN